MFVYCILHLNPKSFSVSTNKQHWESLVPNKNIYTREIENFNIFRDLSEVQEMFKNKDIKVSNQHSELRHHLLHWNKLAKKWKMKNGSRGLMMICKYSYSCCFLPHWWLLEGSNIVCNISCLCFFLSDSNRLPRNPISMNLHSTNRRTMDIFLTAIDSSDTNMLINS